MALVQILYLNPLAASPDRSLAQIYGVLSATNETLGAPMAFALMGIDPRLEWNVSKSYGREIRDCLSDYELVVFLRFAFVICRLRSTSSSNPSR